MSPVFRLLAATLPAVLAGCAGPSGDAPEQLSVTVLQAIPHDSAAYTQGLEIHDGILWESTGLYGQSTLRMLNPRDGTILETRSLPDTLFGEGITIIGDTLYQLTWRAGTVLAWNTDSLPPPASHPLDTEGWGICSPGDGTVFTSDGSSSLIIRSLPTFEALDTVMVTRDGVPLQWLNELEFHDGMVYANRYYSDFVYVIDPSCGKVIAEIDASDLRRTLNAPSAGVLNGIAWDPAGNAFLLTGKNWPMIFAVRIRG